MKHVLIFVFGVLFLLNLLAFTFLEDKTAKLFSQIGITQIEANDYFWSNVTSISFSFPRTQELAALAKGNRPAIVKQCFEYVKQYANSPDFQQRYTEYRNGMKPQPPETLKTMDQLRAEQKKQMLEGKHNLQESMKSMALEQQEQMKTAIETFDTQLKSLDDPNNPMFSSDMDIYRRQAYQQTMDDYAKKIQEWRRQYPENSTAMIKHALEEFLSASDAIDYTAEVFNDDGGKTLFVKTMYEQKPRAWKLCFRAGKETIDAARSAAKQWLKELK